MNVIEHLLCRSFIQHRSGRLATYFSLTCHLVLGFGTTRCFLVSAHAILTFHALGWKFRWKVQVESPGWKFSWKVQLKSLIRKNVCLDPIAQVKFYASWDLSVAMAAIGYIQVDVYHAALLLKCCCSALASYQTFLHAELADYQVGHQLVRKRSPQNAQNRACEAQRY